MKIARHICRGALILLFMETVAVSIADETPLPLETAVKMNPEHPGVHFHLATIYRAQGDKERGQHGEANERSVEKN